MLTCLCYSQFYYQMKPVLRTERCCCPPRLYSLFFAPNLTFSLLPSISASIYYGQQLRCNNGWQHYWLWIFQCLIRLCLLNLVHCVIVRAVLSLLLHRNIFLTFLSFLRSCESWPIRPFINRFYAGCVRRSVGEGRIFWRGRLPLLPPVGTPLHPTAY